MGGDDLRHCSLCPWTESGIFPRVGGALFWFTGPLNPEMGGQTGRPALPRHAGGLFRLLDQETALLPSDVPSSGLSGLAGLHLLLFGYISLHWLFQGDSGELS